MRRGLQVAVLTSKNSCGHVAHRDAMGRKETYSVPAFVRLVQGL